MLIELRKYTFCFGNSVVTNVIYLLRGNIKQDILTEKKYVDQANFFSNLFLFLLLCKYEQIMLPAELQKITTCFFSRRVFMMTYHALRCGKSSALSTQVQLSNIKKELGDVGEEENGHQRCPEVVVHESNLGNIDAQSQILCGIAKV